MDTASIGIHTYYSVHCSAWEGVSRSGEHVAWGPARNCMCKNNVCGGWCCTYVWPWPWPCMHVTSHRHCTCVPRARRRYNAQARNKQVVKSCRRRCRCRGRQHQEEDWKRRRRWEGNTSPTNASWGSALSTEYAAAAGDDRSAHPPTPPGQHLLCIYKKQILCMEYLSIAA